MQRVRNKKSSTRTLQCNSAIQSFRQRHYTGCAKNGQFWKFINPVYDNVERRSIYKNQCSICSEILVLKSQLNILCSRQKKPYNTQNNDSTFTCHVYFNCSSAYRISSNRCNPYVKTFSTLSGVTSVYWISSQLNILCTSTVNLHYAKNNNSPFTPSHTPNFLASSSGLSPVWFFIQGNFPAKTH